MFRTSTVGSMELDVNGKKNAYTWNGEMNRTLTGYDLRADASVNGRKLEYFKFKLRRRGHSSSYS
jgi:hypothetical protein